MNRNRLLELLTKKKSGMITLPESRELNDYLNNNANDKQLSELVDEVFNVTFNFDNVYKKEAIAKSLNSLHRKIDPKEAITYKSYKKDLWIRITSMAAMLIVAVGIAYFYINRHQPRSALKNIVTTKKGSKSILVLPDGSRAWVNADTRISYDKSYGEKNRSIDLVGEAYFDVVKNVELPFIVHTKTMDIKVLGTAFNVRAYENEISTQTTLLRGSVEVILKRKSEERIILKPNEKIIVKNTDSHITSTIDDSIKDIPIISVVTIKRDPIDSSAAEVQWTKNRLVFDQAAFRDIIPELERWFNVKVKVKDSTLLHRKLSGIFENESLSEVLESFKLAAGFKYTISDNNLVIYK